LKTGPTFGNYFFGCYFRREKNVRNLPCKSKARSTDGAHWTVLRELLPLYLSLSKSEVSNGTVTGFCHDCWMPSGPLLQMYLPLYTTNVQEKTVSI
jgi:hypothetical protein